MIGYHYVHWFALFSDFFPKFFFTSTLIFQVPVHLQRGSWLIWFFFINSTGFFINSRGVMINSKVFLINSSEMNRPHDMTWIEMFQKIQNLILSQFPTATELLLGTCFLFGSCLFSTNIGGLDWSFLWWASLGAIYTYAFFMRRAVSSFYPAIKTIEQ